ncbi:MAG TPA: energy transducer TonB [Candidatus Aquilonibacter sp.]|nr:energy transducer TonB [Candidatus Aquilonibacter sp.]
MLRRTFTPQYGGPSDGAVPRAVLALPQDGTSDVALDGMLLDGKMTGGKPLDLLVSIGGHALLICAVLIAPMLVSQRLVLARNDVTALASPPLPYAPPAALGSSRAVVQKANFTVPKHTVPVSTPRLAAAPIAAQSAPDLSDAMQGIAGGLPNGALGGILGGDERIAPPVPMGTVGTLRVGGQVQRPELVYNPDPVYPSKAKKEKVQGDVKIDAIVDKDGNVVEAHALSGPPLLIEAAIKAVSQWKYEPTYLNGSPYPLELVVDVSFRLG